MSGLNGLKKLFLKDSLNITNLNILIIFKKLFPEVSEKSIVQIGKILINTLLLNLFIPSITLLLKKLIIKWLNKRIIRYNIIQIIMLSRWVQIQQIKLENKQTGCTTSN